MNERRKYERLPVNIELRISDLFQESSDGLHGLDAPIEVIDISSHGIGFISECLLPLDFYFNASVKIGETPEIFTVVHLLRCEAIDETHFKYGCAFTNPAKDLTDALAQLNL